MTPVAEHLARTRAAMGTADIDVLLLGREANVRYVSGANRLWLAGTRPFAPSCVVVGRTGAVHLLSVTDDGVPPEIPHEHLYPISWNPLNLVGAAAAASGPAARRVGVDGISPLFEQLIGATFPDVELVDGEAMLREVRRVKSADDIEAIRAAVEVAQAALAAVVVADGPAVDAATLRGVAAGRMGALGVTTPDTEPMIRVEGGQIAARIGVLRDGWAGVLARTWPRGGEVGGRVTAAAAACRPGTSVGELTALGVTVEGLGLGHEELAIGTRLEPGMVLLIAATADGATWADTVLVTDQAPDVLTRA